MYHKGICTINIILHVIVTYQFEYIIEFSYSSMGHFLKDDVKQKSMKEWEKKTLIAQYTQLQSNLFIELFVDFH